MLSWASGLLIAIPKRSVILSPLGFTNADLVEPGKGKSNEGSARKSLLSRVQQAARLSSAERTHVKDLAMEAPSPIPEKHEEEEQDQDADEDGREDPYLQWQRAWVNFSWSDEDENERQPKPRLKRTTPRNRSGVRPTKRLRSEDESDSDSSSARASTRPSRSAKAKITSLREPKLGTKIRAGYPGTFSLDKVVPMWKEKEKPRTTDADEPVVAKKTPRKTPASGPQAATKKTPRTMVPTALFADKTPLSTPRKRNASDIEVIEDDGFRYFSKASNRPASAKGTSSARPFASS